MTRRDKKGVERTFKKIASRTGIVLLSIVVLLVAVRIALPHVIKFQINK